MKKQIIPLIALFALIIVLMGCTTTKQSVEGSPSGAVVTSFDECVAAGYPVMESYPRQCKTPEGQTYTEVPSNTETPAQAANDDTQATPAPVGVVKEFAVRAHQFGFDPQTITVQKGDTVRVTFTSDDTEHGVFFPDFNVRTQPFGKGDSETVEFVADKIGSFTYRCNVFCGSGHKEMTGTLVVTE